MKSATAIAVAAGLASILAGCGYSHTTTYTPRYAYAPAPGYTYTTAPAYPSGYYASSGYYYNPSPYERGSTYTGSDPWWHTRNYRGIHGYPE
jgi:hypothetical protein